MTKLFSAITTNFFATVLFSSCNNNPAPPAVTQDTQAVSTVNETPEYFNLRPALKKENGNTHAVKIGNNLKISGAVSMTDSGTLIAPGNMEQQNEKLL